MEKIQKFQDLNAWKEAHGLVLLIYKLTKNFSAEEKFGLQNQIRRAAVSVSSNIAEGFGRRTKIDKRNFYTMSRTSLDEVLNQIIIARDLLYLNEENYKVLENQYRLVAKLTSGLIKSAENLVY